MQKLTKRNVDLTDVYHQNEQESLFLTSPKITPHTLENFRNGCFYVHFGPSKSKIALIFSISPAGSLYEFAVSKLWV